MENKTIFKVGDKVFDAQYGCGIVTDTDSLRLNMLKLPIKVKFDNEVCFYTLDGKDMFTKPKSVLSFTEYDFVNGGFSQKRPMEVPKKGAICWVRDNEKDTWGIRHFIGMIGSKFIASQCNNEDRQISWNYLTTINPYENEI